MAERVGVLTWKQANSVLTYLKGVGNKRDVALWAVGIGTGLRISDILGLEWSDVLDAENKVAQSIAVTETKTKGNRQLTLLPLVREALEDYRTTDEGRIFNVTRQHARRLVKEWCEAVNLRGNYGTHTMRKVFCTLAYNNSGGDPVATARVTGHANPAQLMHYIGQTAQSESDIWNGIAATMGSK